MIYYTQLIFIKKDQAQEFNLFEEKVIPFLKKYNGKLVYRIRPNAESIIEMNGDQPYEIHIVTFETTDDFRGYMNDTKRQSHLPLKNKSVEKIILIEGKMI